MKKPKETIVRRKSLMKHSLGIVAASLLISTLVFAGSVSAGNTRIRLPEDYHWVTPCDVVYYAPESQFGSRGLTAIQRAMNKWNGYTNYEGDEMVTFVLSDSPTDEEGFRIQNTITFDSLAENDIAHTYHEGTYDGELVSAEIILNEICSFNVGGTNGAIDIQTVVQHELGHALGIAHCHEKGESCSSSTCELNVMYLAIDPGEVRTTLQDYDIGSYKSIYSWRN